MALGGMEGELPPFPLELDQQQQEQQADSLFPPFPALVDALLLDQQAAASLAFPLSRLGRTGEALALYLVWRSLLQEAASSSSLDDACSRFPDHVTRVLSWIRKGALPEHTSARADRVLVYRAASAFLLGFSRLADPSRLSAFTHDFRWVQGWLAHEDRDVRSAMAGFLGRLSLVMDPTQRDVALYTLASAIDTAVTRRDGRAAHGPLLAVGHVHACWLATPTQAGECILPPASSRPDAPLWRDESRDFCKLTLTVIPSRPFSLCQRPAASSASPARAARLALRRRPSRSAHRPGRRACRRVLEPQPGGHASAPAPPPTRGPGPRHAPARRALGG